MTALPVIALRLLDGRVGSTLLMDLLATSDEVATERAYPAGERRYLSYFLRLAGLMGTPWDPAEHPGVTDLLFGPPEMSGPIPFEPSLVAIDRPAPTMLYSIWEAFSAEIRRTNPNARYYAEKLVGDTQLLIDSGIPLRLIDLVRDPRDVFCSIRAFTGSGPGFGRLPDQSDVEHLERMAANHLQQLRAMANTPSDVDRVLVRYEDLVRDVSGHANRLGKWLGLRLDAPRLTSTTTRHHLTSASAAESIGRWRRELEPALATRLWNLLGAELEPLRYTAG